MFSSASVIHTLSKLIVYTVSIFCLIAALSSCDGDPNPIDPPAQAIELILDHEWDGQTLSLNNWYITANNDSFQLTKLVYHINNFSLRGESGAWHVAEKTWAMVNSESSINTTIVLGEMAGKKFNAIRFTIGVADSTVNASGALNTEFTEPMYWGMANGYINFKLEGKSPSVTNQGVVLHAGGYLEPNKAFAQVEIEFAAGALTFNSIGSNKLTMRVNLAECFADPNLIDLATTNEIHAPGSDAVRLSQNWPAMFSFGSIK